MSAPAASIITAGLRPELFNGPGTLSLNRIALTLLLAVLLVAALGFRLTGLSAEGLSEDELQKLLAVQDYRAHGLTAANGEHPLLMKALLTGSLYTAEKWNWSKLVQAHPATLSLSVETALRLPNAFFGALTTLLIYLVASELIGMEAALIAAALWAFDPSAIGFNRIVKEDTLLLFFFLLANVFWLRAQRIAESVSERKARRYYWATAIAYGAMLASKYAPFLIPVTICYYYTFQRIPAARWRLGKPRMILFFVVMGLAFLIFNPTILLPATWQQMRAMASGKLVGHDSYEFMGQLYPHKVTDWLKGVPWYFYFVFIAVKLPLLTLAGFITGLPLLFRRRLGDGRFFLLFWMFYFILAFVPSGGKFTRYFTPALPSVLMTAALGIQFAGRWLAEQFAALSTGASTRAHTSMRGRASASMRASMSMRGYVYAVLVALVLLSSVWASASAAPHYRLYSNALGGGTERAGYFFPHDEFYDASVRDVMFEIAKRARPGARVASEAPGLAAYYAEQAGRADLSCVTLSDPSALKDFGVGDFVIAARGRRYFSNDALLSALAHSSAEAFRVSLGRVPSATVYMLDQSSLQTFTDHTR